MHAIIRVSIFLLLIEFCRIAECTITFQTSTVSDRSCYSTSASLQSQIDILGLAHHEAGSMLQRDERSRSNSEAANESLRRSVSSSSNRQHALALRKAATDERITNTSSTVKHALGRNWVQAEVNADASMSLDQLSIDTEHRAHDVANRNVSTKVIHRKDDKARAVTGVPRVVGGNADGVDAISNDVPAASDYEGQQQGNSSLLEMLDHEEHESARARSDSKSGWPLPLEMLLKAYPNNSSTPYPMAVSARNAVESHLPMIWFGTLLTILIVLYYAGVHARSTNWHSRG